MKPLPQFFALMRYHLFASPWIWVVPLAFGLQPLLVVMSGSGRWSSATAELASLTTLGMLPMMTAAFVFAGDKLIGGTPGLTAQTHQQIQTFSGEFLLTRAVDRPMVFRARIFVYWMLVLLPLLALLVAMACRPGLTVMVSSDAAADVGFYLNQLPGATLSETARKGTQAVFSSHGWVTFGMAVALAGAAAAAVWPMVIFAILPWRFRKWIFCSLFATYAFLPLVLIRQGMGKTNGVERSVFWVMNHLEVCAAVVLVLAVTSYLFTAARNREMEYA